jgi:Family of unknown function (DUF6452)
MKPANLRKIPAFGRNIGKAQKLYLRFQKLIVKYIFLIFFTFLFTSCFTQNDCIITSTNLVKIDFFTLAGVIRPTTFLSVHNTDSTVIYYPALGATPAPINTLALPLDQDTNESSFVLVTTENVKYTLTLGYTSFSRVISTDCGAYQYFKDLSVPQTSFDSTRVISPQLFTSVKQNVKIFF